MTAPLPPRWLWVRPEARPVLATRDLAAILRCYRNLTGMSQAALADALGYDPSYISLLEQRKRTITDRTGLSYLSRALGIPPHVLGIAADDDADFLAALQFGESTVRLAEIARRAGRAAEAADELWPLIARLESRLAEGRVDAPTVALLARARVAFGTSLGHVLAEEQLFIAARWTGRALVLARYLDDPHLMGEILRMHGNELRKAGRLGAAVARLSESTAIASGAADRGQALVLLARAAGEQGDAALFDRTIAHAERLLDARGEGSGILFTPFTLHEVRIRGLAETGRAREAAALALRPVSAEPAPAPQWHAIERVTTGAAFLQLGDTAGGDGALASALDVAARHRLPHQVQRVIRLKPDVADPLRARADELLLELRRPRWPHLTDHRPLGERAGG